MKKIGLICLAVVLTLGIGGVGFGWWSETLDIGQNQVDTGNMEVVFCDNKGNPSPNPYTLTITFNDVYPGWQGQRKAFMKNTGTVPAKIDTVTVSYVSGSQVIYDNMRAGGDMHRLPGWIYLGKFNGGKEYYNQGPLNDLGTNASSTGIEDVLKAKNFVLLPGQWLRFSEEGDNSIYFSIDGEAAIPENATMTFTITFTWVPFNH